MPFFVTRLYSVKAIFGWAKRESSTRRLMFFPPQEINCFNFLIFLLRRHPAAGCTNTPVPVEDY